MVRPSFKLKLGGPCSNELKVGQALASAYLIREFVGHIKRGLALILENKASKTPLKDHVVSIDRLEEISGLDFLVSVDDEKEDFLEEDQKPDDWSWSRSKTTTSYKSFEYTSPKTATLENYWISKSGKRHNSKCRYYEKSKGRSGLANEGAACKICGG